MDTLLRLAERTMVPALPWALREEVTVPNTKQLLTVIVDGEPIEVEANPEAPLRTIVPEALRKAEVVGQPVENWEVRDAQDRLLDLGQKIGTFGFTASTILSLSPKAGIGG